MSFRPEGSASTNWRKCLQARPSCSIHRSGRASRQHRPLLRRPRVRKRRFTASIPGSENWRRNEFRRTRPTLLQRNLIVSHCCGVGPPTPEPIVRLMMALKIVSLGRGASGVRREIIEQLQAMLARGIYPLVPQQGSVGASGDLAPLAHMTAVMIGEGQALVDGKVVPGRDALAAAGLAPMTLGPKEGLALINGTQFSTAYAISGLLRAHGLALRDAGDRRLVGRCGDGFDGAVPPRDPATARACRANRRRRGADGVAGRQRHPAFASRRRRARAGSLLPALSAAGGRRRA